MSEGEKAYEVFKTVDFDSNNDKHFFEKLKVKKVIKLKFLKRLNVHEQFHHTDWLTFQKKNIYKYTVSFICFYWVL